MFNIITSFLSTFLTQEYWCVATNCWTHLGCTHGEQKVPLPHAAAGTSPRFPTISESERNFHAESWDTSILHVFTSPYVEVTRRWVCKPFVYCFKVLVPSTHKVLSNCTQQKGPDPTSWTFLTCVVHFLRSHENLEHPKWRFGRKIRNALKFRKMKKRSVFTERKTGNQTKKQQHWSDKKQHKQLKNVFCLKTPSRNQGNHRFRPSCRAWTVHRLGVGTLVVFGLWRTWLWGVIPCKRTPLEQKWMVGFAKCMDRWIELDG